MDCAALDEDGQVVRDRRVSELLECFAREFASLVGSEGVPETFSSAFMNSSLGAVATAAGRRDGGSSAAQQSDQAGAGVSSVQAP